MANKSIGLLNIVFGADLRGFDRAMKKAQKNLKKFGNNLKTTGKNLTQSLTLPLVALGVAGVRAFDKQTKAIAQVEAGLKSTGNQVGITSEELQQMAADLQKTTLFGDEEILQGATAQLLTFTNIAGEQFERTQVVALDLATRLDGDLKSASIMLGKALNDPVANLSALSRAGIQFSTEQKDLVKSLVETNRLADAQTIILNELEKQYGGSAEAAAQAGLGPVQQLGNVLSDISEDIGAILLPIIQKLAQWITKIAEKFRNLDEPTKNIVVNIGLFLAVLGPLLVIIGKLAIGVSALIPIFAKLGAVLIANPIGIVITAIGALVGAIYWLSTSTSDTAKKIRNAFKFMANAIIAHTNFIIKGINAINPFKQIPLIKKFTYEATGQFEEVGDSASDAAKEIENLGKSLGEGATPQFAPIEDISGAQFSPIDDVVELDILLNMSSVEDQMSEIITWDGWQSIEDKNKETVEGILADWQRGIENIKKVLSSLGGFLSANSQKQQAEFDIWKQNQDEKASILEEELEKNIESVENSTLSEEEKQLRITALQEQAAEKKAQMDKQAEKKEREMRRRQAINDKAMGIASAIVSTVEGVMGAIAASPLTLGQPWSAIIAGLGAMQVAQIASTPIPFAKGGLVSGPVMGLVGEGSGTSAFNPEVISPLDKLMSMMGGNRVTVSGRIQGDDIVLISDKATISRERFI